VSQSVESSEGKKRTKGRRALWIAVVSIIAWLSIGGFSGAAFSKISTVQENDNSAFLPENAESTIAGKITVKFSSICRHVRHKSTARVRKAAKRIFCSRRTVTGYSFR